MRARPHGRPRVTARMGQRMPPRVCFRTGGGRSAGFGHVRRSLTLAAALDSLGVESVFLLAGDPGVQAAVEQAGFAAEAITPGRHGDDVASTVELSLARHASTIVVDTYDYRTGEFAALKESGLLTVAIDDLADRKIPVDVVVNGAAWVSEADYAGLLVEPPPILFLGPRHVLLRPEFARDAEDGTTGRSRHVRRVLITLGGSDPFDLTPRLVEWTCTALAASPVWRLDEIEAIDVVVGPLFGDCEMAALRRHGDCVQVHHNPSDLHRLMRTADLAICGGGQTTYELAASGTPAIAIQIADNQARSLRALADARTLVHAGKAWDPALQARVTCALKRLATAPEVRTDMGRRGRTLVDGHGARRVAHAIADLIGSCQ